MIVTIRYAGNLLRKGKNNEFVILDVLRQHHEVDEITVGYYFDATIIASSGQKRTATGVTPLQAVERCLVKHGVTFR